MVVEVALMETQLRAMSSSVGLCSNEEVLADPSKDPDGLP